MELVKQDIGVWVTVDEPPKDEGTYTVQIYRSEKQMYFNGKRFESEAYKKPTLWLKPIKEVYVLTHQELSTLVFTAVSNNNIENSKKSIDFTTQFIQSITKNKQ